MDLETGTLVEHTQQNTEHRTQNSAMAAGSRGHREAQARFIILIRAATAHMYGVCAEYENELAVECVRGLNRRVLVRTHTLGRNSAVAGLITYSWS